MPAEGSAERTTGTIVHLARPTGHRLSSTQTSSYEVVLLTEEDARFNLLQIELNAIQSAIRNFDTIAFQIKGWCVTASLAIGGFAVAYHKPALILIGAGAIIGFFLVDCQFRTIQRAFIRKNAVIDSELQAGIMEMLKDGGSLQIVGTGIPMWRSRDPSRQERVASFFAGLLAEGRMPNTFGLYLFILVCLLTEALLLL